MPRKKATKAKSVTKKARKVQKPQAVTKQSSNVFEYLRFGESYTSLVLGIIAVIIATVLLLSFFNARQNKLHNDGTVPTPVSIETMNITPGPDGKVVLSQGDTYTVAPNDSLWSIAERVYNDGYKWVEIAKANNIANPNIISAGDKLKLPKVTLPDATVQTGENEAEVNHTERKVETIKNPTYTVVAGDDLWDIAERVYGDGYQWVKIAEENHLKNPDVIHVGNVLQIPRN